MPNVSAGDNVMTLLTCPPGSPPLGSCLKNATSISDCVFSERGGTGIVGKRRIASCACELGNSVGNRLIKESHQVRRLSDGEGNHFIFNFSKFG